MLHFSLDLHQPVPEAILSELKSAITNKLTLVVCPDLVFYSYDVLPGPETFVAAHDYWRREPTYGKMLWEILNKRWQTLDVESMVSEFRRSSSGYMLSKNTLSSVHRFKRKEGASLS